jgi:hypothetical protein
MLYEKTKLAALRQRFFLRAPPLPESGEGCRAPARRGEGLPGVGAYCEQGVPSGGTGLSTAGFAGALATAAATSPMNCVTRASFV